METQSRKSDNQNYSILFERFRTLANQQKVIVQKCEDADVTEKTLREE